jgi:hypothetical protein
MDPISRNGKNLFYDEGLKDLIIREAADCPSNLTTGIREKKSLFCP